jgi:hypothetical protein
VYSVLLDTSASMMEDDVVKVIRLRNEPEAARKLAPKWRRAIDMVEWVSAQLPANSQFQVYGFNVKARAVVADTHGKWLDSNDPRAINNVLAATRNIVPGDGTSLVNAFIAVRTINPQPDQIILITDGLPTQGSVPPSRKFINVRDREKLFDDACKTVTRDMPMDIVLLPMKGDLLAAHAYWRLARKTGGSYVIPSRDWPDERAIGVRQWQSANVANSKSSRCRSSTASVAASAPSSCCWCSPTSASPS